MNSIWLTSHFPLLPFLSVLTFPTRYGCCQSSHLALSLIFLFHLFHPFLLHTICLQLFFPAYSFLSALFWELQLLVFLLTCYFVSSAIIWVSIFSSFLFRALWLLVVLRTVLPLLCCGWNRIDESLKVGAGLSVLLASPQSQDVPTGHSRLYRCSVLLIASVSFVLLLLCCK